jgi:serine/threonine protein kinase
MNSGDTIGKYRLVSRLGQGGMGEVWLATANGHGGFSKNVVLKTLLPEYAHDPLFIEMLAHEARICAKLSHPNLIQVFDFTENDGTYLLAMEHVVGRPLHHIVRAAKMRNWSVPAWFALRVAWECCRGLAYAHEQGVVHCDLSPSNVMVTFTGLTKILDFGVAHSLDRGPKADRLKGKFSYIAPERIKSLVTDCRTDIYSLGVMLYLVFTGQLPFSAGNDEELLYKIVKTKPRPPSELAPIDSRIERIILRAMQADPAKRYQKMVDVLADLSPCLEGQLGTYGQHDVANFVGRLFDMDDKARPTNDTQPVRTASNEASDLATNDPSAWLPSNEVEEIEVGSAILEIPIEEPAKPRQAAVTQRLARGSASTPPMDKPVQAPAIAPLVPMPLPSQPRTTTPLTAFDRLSAQNREMLDSPSKLFDHVPEVHEARTTVQSLFGERHNALAFGPSKIFDRRPFGTGAEPSSDDDLTPQAPAADDPDATPPPPEEPEVTRTPRSGGFGSYSIQRPQGQKVWPWSSSRTKSD